MKKALALFMTVVMVLMTMSFPASAVENSDTGFTFTGSYRYRLSKPFDVMPGTFEATIRLPKNQVAVSCGVIAGNNGMGSSINFEIYKGGKPRLYVTGSGKTYDWIFDKVDVRTGEWLHIAIVRDAAAQQLHCYIDGELRQTISTGEYKEIVSAYPLVIGGSMRSDRMEYFKGEIETLAIYSDARSADEVKADITTLDKSELLAAYDLKDLEPGVESIPDQSGNNYTAKKQNVSTQRWLDESPVTGEYAYSFAAIGDTQALCQSFPEQYAAMYDWIVDNVESKQMKFVFGLGDITEGNTDAEYRLARENMDKMNSVVRYSMCRGNHETIEKMNRFFPALDYFDVLGGCYKGGIENAWQELMVGDIPYLMMNLDYGAADDVLAWANEVIAAHPYHNVIITTHAYLANDGTPLSTDRHSYVPTVDGAHLNNGDDMWDGLFSQHENIVMVLCGHLCDFVTTQTEGVHGNTVVQMMMDPTHLDIDYWGAGLVSMFYFSEDGRQVQVEHYSTVRQQWYKRSDAIELDIVEPTEEEAAAIQKAADAIDAIGGPNTITKENYQAKQKLAANAQAAVTELVDTYGEGILVLVGNYDTYLAVLDKIAGFAYTLGDINEDGEKNAADALLALQHSVKLTTLKDGQFSAADVDENGDVNASDALYILQHSVKLIEKFPAEQ